jgi:hypothetical protein
VPAIRSIEQTWGDEISKEKGTDDSENSRRGSHASL